MSYENLIPIVGVITNISTQEGDCCTQVIALSVEGRSVNIISSDDTFVADTMRLIPDMRVIALYNSTPPVFPIYSPQYQVVLIVVVRPEGNVSLSWFDEILTASD